MEIDSYSYINRMSKIHPVEKLLFAIMTMLLCFWFDRYTNLLVVFMMFIIIVYIAKIPYKVYIKLILIPFSFLIISVLTIVINVLDDKSVAIISIKVFGAFIGITSDGINTAFNLTSRTLALVSCLYFLTLTTPITDIVDVLEKIKIPMLFLELTQITYRLIFVLLNAAKEIYISQDSRLGYSKVKNGYRSLGFLISSLFVKSYRDSQNLYLALEARGYKGDLKVISKKQKINIRNCVIIFLIELILINLSLFLRR